MSLPAGRAAVVFLSFAFAYFLSALLRAVTATLAPAFSAELALTSGDLGLLSGAYFFGFALLQLPLGRALDRFGPRRTLLVLLAVAVAGCAAFAASSGLLALIASRVLIGAGVSACLMAALTCFRHVFSPLAQLRANSWMLMTGSLGMVASTLPVQLLLPTLGWRGLFWGLAVLLVLAAALVAWGVPKDGSAAVSPGFAGSGGYAGIVRHPMFVAAAPLAFFVYGGMIAVQALWAGPWLTRVAGWTPAQAAQGLFFVNLAMLLAFAAWGTLMPWLTRRGLTPWGLVAGGLPLSLGLLAAIVVLGPRAEAAHWAVWCVSCTFVSLSQPALGAAFEPAQAGRALSAYNLVIFAGVFSIQWGLGLLVDALRAAGLDDVGAFRWAFAVFGACGMLAYLWFLRLRGAAAHNPP